MIIDREYEVSLINDFNFVKSFVFSNNNIQYIDADENNHENNLKIAINYIKTLKLEKENILYIKRKLMFDIVIKFLTYALDYYEKEVWGDIGDRSKKEILHDSLLQTRVNDNVIDEITEQKEEYQKTVNAFLSLGPLGAREMERYFF